MTEQDMEIQQLWRDNKQLKEGLKNLRIILEKSVKECDELRTLNAVQHGEIVRLRRTVQLYEEEKEALADCKQTELSADCKQLKGEA